MYLINLQSAVFHLVPFYNGEKENVIPVYENSFYFQGYVAQGFKSFFNKDLDDYFFISDDLILNPIINEKNYSQHLKLSDNACFLPELLDLYKRKEWWARVGEAFRYKIKVFGVEAENQIPSYELAIQQFSKHNLQIQSLSFDQVYEKVDRPKSLKYKQKLLDYLYYKVNKLKNKSKPYNLSYPLIGAYSDIFLVNAENIKLFCHYCGVFAATDLFVEIGLPTSMVLSASKIVTEEDLDLKGKALWTNDDYQILEKYNSSLNMLFEDFPENYLYLHPIKVSKWRMT